MNVSELFSGIERLIPTGYAEPWDPAGFQVGDPGRTVKSVLLALDLTMAAISEAKHIGADLIICHHPPIFKPLTGLRLDRTQEALLHELVRSDLSLFALHTSLDAVPGGVADQFAALLGLNAVETLVPLMPDRIAAVPLPDGIWRRQFPVQPGFGRTGRLPAPLLLSGLSALLRALLATPNLLITADHDRMLAVVTVCPGSFDDDWIDLLREQGSELLICGELKYHSQLALIAAGIAVIATGHDVSERVVLQPLADLLAGQYPEIKFAVSPPFDYNKMAF